MEPQPVEMKCTKCGQTRRMVPVTQFSATVGEKTPTVVPGFEFGYVVKCEVCAEKYYFIPKEVLDKLDKGRMSDKAILFSYQGNKEGKG